MSEWVSSFFYFVVECTDILEEHKAGREQKTSPQENVFSFSDDLSSLAKIELHLFLSFQHPFWVRLCARCMWPAKTDMDAAHVLLKIQ